MRKLTKEGELRLEWDEEDERHKSLIKHKLASEDTHFFFQSVYENKRIKVVAKTIPYSPD